MRILEVLTKLDFLSSKDFCCSLMNDLLTVVRAGSKRDRERDRQRERERE